MGNIRGEKNQALVDSLLLKLLTNSLHKRQTSLVMSFVTLYLAAPRFESQNYEDRKKKNGVRRWEELLEEEKN